MNLRMTTFLAVAAMAAVAVACDNTGSDVLIPGTPPGSGGGGSGPQGSPAFEYFKENVHPALELTCTYCHAAIESGVAVSIDEVPGQAPQWLALEVKKSYEQLEEYGSLIAHPDNSLLVLQGEHMGPALQPQQEAVVREWLLMEVEERGLPTPDDPVEPGDPPATTAKDALEGFAACMTRQVWDEYAMYELPFSQTSGWGTCVGCHTRGWAGTFLDDDQDLNYQQNKKIPYLLKLVTAEVDDNGAFVDLKLSYRFRDKGYEKCTYEDPSLCHPKYALTPGVNANIEGLFAAVYDAWKNDTCGMPPDDGMGGGGGMGGAGGAGQ